MPRFVRPITFAAATVICLFTSASASGVTPLAEQLLAPASPGASVNVPTDIRARSEVQLKSLKNLLTERQVEVEGTIERINSLRSVALD